MSNKPFEKFIHKADTGAKKKEKIRQEKKKLRAEKNAWFEEQKKLARERAASGKGQPNQRTRTKAPGANAQRKAAPPPVESRPHKIHVPKTIEKRRVQTEKKRSPAENKTVPATAENQMPLNKFIAWCGVCGRREAAELIKGGEVMVNNVIITEPPHRVSEKDLVKVNGKKIAIQKNLVYILLNKPKDYITTTDDPEGRKTVMDLVKQATRERVFPVGRLDRNTTGVLLLTNDGELAQRLTHPKYQVKKIYEVRVDKPVSKQQLDQIAGGLTLEDGFIQPDSIAFADPKDKSVIGIEIHSGKNRIVRRIFEHFGFKVKNLDRVMYGIFTKKNIERGKWRLLTEKEIRLLKHLNTSFGNKKTS